MMRLEPGGDGRQEELASGQAAADCQPARRSAGKVLQHGPQLASLTEDAFSVFECQLASIGQCHAVRQAMQQFNAPLLLEFPHLSGNRGLTNAQLLGCPRDAAQLGDPMEEMESLQIQIGAETRRFRYRMASVGSCVRPQHEGLDRAGNVLQVEASKLLETEIEPFVDMITHRSRHADAARRTLGLKPCCHVDHVAVEVSPVGNHVADVDTDPKADGSIRRLLPVVDRNLLLHRHGTAYRAIYAVEHDQQRVATGLDDASAMLTDHRVDHVFAESTQPLKRSNVVKPDKTAVPDHIGIDDGDQLPPALRSSGQIRCVAQRHGRHPAKGRCKMELLADQDRKPTSSGNACSARPSSDGRWA